MKKNHRTALRASGSLLAAATLAAAGNAQAQVIHQTIDQAGGAAAGWAAAIWGGPPAAAPAAGNHYASTSAQWGTNMTVRTPNNNSPVAFAGDSLALTNGTLMIKHSTGVATVNLILAPGTILHNQGPSLTVNSPLGGTLLVAADSQITAWPGGGQRNIELHSTLSGNANLNVAMGNFALILADDGTAYSGNWTVSTGRIEITNGAVNPFGSGNVTLANVNNTLVLNSTTDITVNNAIGGAGSVIKRNSGTATLGGNNTFIGPVTVNEGTLVVSAPAAIANSLGVTLGGGTLDVSGIGGLTLNAAYNQVLSGSGTVNGGVTAATGSSLSFNLTATTNDILNITGPLTLDGNPTLSLSLASYKASGRYRLINYQGTIQGGGAFILVPPDGSSATFELDTTVPGQVDLIITATPQALVWVGDGSGNAWDTVTPNWTGTATTFSVGDNVTFNDTGSASPEIYVSVPVVPGNMTVNNADKTYTFYGEGISSFGTLTKMGANELIFTSPNNGFTGPIDIRDGILSIGGGGSFGRIGAPSSVTNNGTLKVNLATGGLAINAPISGMGDILVTGGGGNLTLTATNSYTGLTTIDYECQLNTLSPEGLGSTSTGTVVLPNGRLGVNAFVGSMTLLEPVTVSGGGISAAPGALYVNTASNNVTFGGPITIVGDTRFRAVNPSARMNFSNTVLGESFALQCTVGGAAPDTNTTISFQNTFSIGSGALTKDGQGILEFAGNSNMAGSTTVDSGILRVNGTFNGGPVAVNPGAGLEGSGTILGAVTVTDGFVAPGSRNIGTLTINNTLAMSGATVTTMELNRESAQNTDRVSATSLSVAGKLNVVNLGPALQVGDTFHLFAGTIAGAFAETVLPDLPSQSYYWDISLLESQGIIRVAVDSSVLPLEITSVIPQPENLTVEWQSNPNRVYTIEYSTDLATWNVMKENIPASAGTTTEAVIDLTGADSGNGAMLAQYRMGSLEAQVQDPAVVVAGALTPGVGTSFFNPNSSLGYPSDPVLQITAGTTGADLAAALANQAWFTFTLTVGAGVTDLDLTLLDFNGARGGGATPRGYAVYVTTPTTADEELLGATAFATQRPTWTPQTLDLTGFSSLQNLTAGQVITFKVPFFAPQASQSIELDDLTIRGNVTPGPLPPYAGAGKLFLRIKEH